MAVSVVKLRMLYIMKILLEKTDEGHTMSAADIGRALKGYGMSADRKTIYSDIETLREFKLDILNLSQKLRWRVIENDTRCQTLAPHPCTHTHTHSTTIHTCTGTWACTILCTHRVKEGERKRMRERRRR